jgi:hypothetical protein
MVLRGFVRTAIKRRMGAERGSDVASRVKTELKGLIRVGESEAVLSTGGSGGIGKKRVYGVVNG